MKIQKIEYQDQEYKWKIETLDLLPNLTLLVGGSGAGKTQILDAIFNLKKIANGASFNGLKWDIYFATENNVNYRWKGEFETQKIDEPFLEKIIREEHEFYIADISLGMRKTLIYLSELFLTPEGSVILIDEVEINNYYLISGNGYPAIISDGIPNAIDKITEVSTYDYLVICIDADEDTVEKRKKYIYDFIKENKKSGSWVTAFMTTKATYHNLRSRVVNILPLFLS